MAVVLADEFEDLRVVPEGIAALVAMGAVVLVIIFHIVLRRTRWGLHTIAVGGNALGAREAGVNVSRIKYGNFMITGALGAFVGLQVAFQTSVIDPSSGGFQPSGSVVLPSDAPKQKREGI